MILMLADNGLTGDRRQSLADLLNCENDHDPLYTLSLMATHVEPAVQAVPEDHGDGEVMLHWTAPGDDGGQGRASGYDIRYRPDDYGPINSELRWAVSTQAVNEPMPSMAGNRDSMLVTGLNSGEGYYFAIKTYDDVGNYSGLSNSPLKFATNLGYTVSVQVQGSGSIYIYPERYYFQYGENVVLYAYPSTGWEFGNWSGDIQSAANPISFTITGDLEIVATFNTDYIPGDANGDGYIWGSDVTYLVMYLAGRVPAPNPYWAGDANGSCRITGGDVTYLVSYLRMIVPAPIRGNCDGLSISINNPEE
jgi:hypothetical protein